MKIEVSPDWWKSLFDEVYLLTDARTVCNDEVTRREVEVLCELLPLAPTHRILDLCGGQGRHSLELAARGYRHCTVFDYSQSLLERGRSASARLGHVIDFVQGDATATGLPSSHFDHVLILGNSLGYLPEVKDDLLILAEAMRLLRPGGWLLVDVTDGDVIRENFKPNAWHEIEGKFVVCRQRQLLDNGIKVREVVLCKERGLIREQTYAIRTYGEIALKALIGQAGFRDFFIRNGYSFRDRDGDYGFMTHRLLAMARKDA